MAGTLPSSVLSGRICLDTLYSLSDIHSRSGTLMSETLLHSGAAEDTPSAVPAGSSATHLDNPMVLRMVDWRGCAALEYVPGRNGGQATFIGRRIPAQTLVSWLATGGTVETFPEAFRVDMGSVRAVHEYMTSGPPVGTVDLTGCRFVELTCLSDVPGYVIVGPPPPPLLMFAGTLAPCRSVVRLPEGRENSPGVQRHIRRGLRTR